MDIAMGTSYIDDTIQYRAKIESKSPRLHDNTMPISLREKMTYVRETVGTSRTDWEIYSIANGLEL